MVKTRKELVRAYIEFYKSKGHKEIPNVSLVPEHDPTVLFTTAGMHPLVPFLLGQPHPLGKRLCNVQRCIRTGDIEEVGDKDHHTFFEMLGNWSLGDYFKKEAIEYSFEFFTKVLKLPFERLAVTCFAGDKDAPRDEESARTWASLGIPKERIAFLTKKDNWWGPAGKTGPCGPDTEIFCYMTKNAPKKFDPEDKNWVEIGNDVIMEYNKTSKAYEKAKQRNVDFGGGVERMLIVLEDCDESYMTCVWKPIINRIEKLSGKRYGDNEQETRAMRIIADHIKASVFIIADGITPSNVEQGYVLRRLIRRAIRYGRLLAIENFTKSVAQSVFPIYDDYENVNKNEENILTELEKEEKRFLSVLKSGLGSFEKITKEKKKISGKDAFLLYQSYGFPIEMTKELAEEKGISVDEKEFEKELTKHQQKSRTATQGRFKSGLADHSTIVTRLHTATHLLHQALRDVLGKHVMQKGSNITPERLRFDFSHDKKMSDEEIKKTENIVNEKIKQGLEVKREEMTLEEARKKGAMALFEGKYDEKVSVYSIGSYSKEVCTGPHVKNISELGHFKILKEEAVAAGIRRIKARLE